ncbi:LSU ribosomalprotein L33p, zinc-dependent [Mycoplasmopsis meleagridis]|nr:50S ribosomal protein L33 [Mycoplasmopsis meleagridis]OAD18204.1 LSU ribosomalprotein L33p, zinc-dependent [Mycoplasmopsis meleagridis]
MEKRKITLGCSLCYSHNYTTNKGNINQERIIIKKFCKKCKIHTIHKEEK